MSGKSLWTLFLFDKLNRPHAYRTLTDKEHYFKFIEVKSRTVYAGNLSWSTTEEQLKAFANVGDGVLSAEVKRHEDTKRSKGWGYKIIKITCHLIYIMRVAITFFPAHSQTKKSFT